MAAALKVVIVGAGLGGLAAAIACRHGDLEVTILERAAKIGNVGAGIQVPPNGSKTLKRLGVLSQIEESSTALESIDVRRYADGSLLVRKPLGETSTRLFGEQWRVIHREDYHAILLKEATRLGAKLQLDAQVEKVSASGNELTMVDGSTVQADVIIGADGTALVVLARSQLEALNDPSIEEMCAEKRATLWLGPDKHCIFYPIRAGSAFNLVLLRPDDLPAGVRTAEGDISEMRATFDDWDPTLKALISCIPSVLKWKLMHHEELETWVQGNAVLLGDACHPTLPYQAQGAAMAVEDGAVLGYLLSAYQRDLQADDGKLDAEPVNSVLKLYERMRKRRTTLNVAGADQNRIFYHMHDGPEQQERDAEMAGFDFDKGRSSHGWLDSEYNKDLLGYDAVEDAAAIYRQWRLPTASSQEAPFGKTVQVR
ncbi:hypothetical protein CBER1_10380 [Cercospora berteroae]|uniref:FAD-binding domain-containing protein n=1 Tax=Cercospora berteroae TaxID=357750 RepID=A0A2S6BYA0_9PEZI|nr:hypothetical protein CBER1_10380 [Cercospora berteroae]